MCDLVAACQKIISSKYQNLTPNNSRPNTPNHGRANSGYYNNASAAPVAPPPASAAAATPKQGFDTHSTGSSHSGSGNLPTATPSNSSHNIQVNPALSNKHVLNT